MGCSPPSSSKPELVTHEELARWAADCAKRVLPIFEGRHPGDDRPRRAIDALRAWMIDDASVTSCRKAAFDAHTAARAAERAGADSAVAAARAAGQAAAVAHVVSHARHAGVYAAKAVGMHTADDGGWHTERIRQWNDLSPGSRLIAFPTGYADSVS